MNDPWLKPHELGFLELVKKPTQQELNAFIQTITTRTNHRITVSNILSWS